MWREILGLEKKPSSLLELITPRRTFSDVVLPDETRQQLYEALTQIEKHRLIFSSWGLGERHPTGMGLVFNFAGPPGTGKSICAEAVAFTLGRKLLRVRYSELDSLWVGETGKNIRTVFREAHTQDAVLLFDEADSVAARRFTNAVSGHEREANLALNILLKEVEEHEGVVIFATNMAANFDPAFERRIRTHILFRSPNVSERERIWKVQIHPTKTPLGTDVDFRELAERFEVTGGDIRNAVLKAAQMAAAEEGPDETKRILRKHFAAAMEQVLAAKQVMQQNAVDPLQQWFPWQEAVQAAEKRLEEVEGDLHGCRTELGMLHESQAALGGRVGEGINDLGARADALDSRVAELGEEARRAVEQQASAIQVWMGEQGSSIKQIEDRLETRLARVTIVPLPRAAALLLALMLLLVAGLSGWMLHG